jgi:hypothetical protein
MKQTLTIPETFLGVGYTRDRAGLPLEAVRVPVPQPGADQVLIRVAASSLNPLEYKLAELNFLGRTPPRRPGPRPVRIRGGERQRGARCNRWRRSGGDGGFEWERRLGRWEQRRNRLCAREGVLDRPQTRILELPRCGSIADVLSLRFRGHLPHNTIRRHRLYPWRRGWCWASRRANGRAYPGGRIGN